MSTISATTKDLSRNPVLRRTSCQRLSLVLTSSVHCVIRLPGNSVFREPLWWWPVRLTIPPPQLDPEQFETGKPISISEHRPGLAYTFHSRRRTCLRRSLLYLAQSRGAT